MVPFNTLLCTIFFSFIYIYVYFLSFYREFNTCVFQQRIHHLKTCKFFLYYLEKWKISTVCISSALSRPKADRGFWRQISQHLCGSVELLVPLHSYCPEEAGWVGRNQSWLGQGKPRWRHLVIFQSYCEHKGWVSTGRLFFKRLEVQGDGPVSQVPAVQTQGPEFRTPAPMENQHSTSITPVLGT